MRRILFIFSLKKKRADRQTKTTSLLHINEEEKRVCRRNFKKNVGGVETNKVRVGNSQRGSGERGSFGDRTRRRFQRRSRRAAMMRALRLKARKLFPLNP